MKLFYFASFQFFTGLSIYPGDNLLSVVSMIKLSYNLLPFIERNPNSKNPHFYS